MCQTHLAQLAMGDSSQPGLQSPVHMLPSLSPNVTLVTPNAVCLGPTHPSYTGQICRHCLQGTVGIGRQVRGLTLPQGHQPLLTPQTRAHPTHQPHGGILGPLPDALSQMGPAGG